jgi:hypothetical protein
MQRLEVSGAVQHIYGPLSVKRLKSETNLKPPCVGHHIYIIAKGDKRLI